MLKNGVDGVYMLPGFIGTGYARVGIPLGVAPWKYPQCPVVPAGAYCPGVITGLGVGWCVPMMVGGANVVRRCVLGCTWLPVVKL